VIELVDCDESHRWLLHEWRNSEAVAPYMYDDKPISRETHDAWYSRLLQREGRRAWVVSMDDRPVGAAFVSGHSQENRRASWAFYLADQSTRGRGVGSAVEYYVLEHAFGDLGLNKLCCEVLSFNTGVLAMHKKFGFVEEGLLRDHWLRDGVWVHTHLLAMFADVWASRRVEFAEKLSARGLIR
jgi:UDP-4-amino-4,6-dideoxy-N-acetyl-beta-L-altrosamine N-acetyltransferase